MGSMGMVGQGDAGRKTLVGEPDAVRRVLPLVTRHQVARERTSRNGREHLRK